ncbi:MAG: glycosyltransferase [Lachnospiraceae bacterium]|nr:glycosyltransferase [Lachnospiraceae bacterium]
MKILFIEWASFGNADIKDAFTKEGHQVICFPFSNKDARRDVEIESALTKKIRETVPGAVFSFNYFPLVSNVCKREDLPYISWIYDSPYVMLYSYTAINPCNTIYVFDRALCREFNEAGIQTVRYLPMAANTDRLDKIAPLPAASASAAVPDAVGVYDAPRVPGCPYLYDVSFVGSLYTESHNFFDRMENLSAYAKGYLEGLMHAQMNVQGCNFIQESLSPIMEELYQALPMDPNPDGVETREYLYAQYVVNRKLTGLERLHLLTAVTQRHTLDLFTLDPAFSLPNLRNHGTADYYTEMPLVFKKSRINLNISLRSIKSGIPLRAFDIMGSGGFLLSNYQEDFLENFTPEVDFVYYESEKDLLQKIDYYLTHEAERTAIAKNGHDKVAAAHTYRDRVREMLARL